MSEDVIIASYLLTRFMATVELTPPEHAPALIARLERLEITADTEIHRRLLAATVRFAREVFARDDDTKAYPF